MIPSFLPPSLPPFLPPSHYFPPRFLNLALHFCCGFSFDLGRPQGAPGGRRAKPLVPAFSLTGHTYPGIRNNVVKGDPSGGFGSIKGIFWMGRGGESYFVWIHSKAMERWRHPEGGNLARSNKTRTSLRVKTWHRRAGGFSFLWENYCVVRSALEKGQEGATLDFREAHFWQRSQGDGIS